MSTVFTFPGKMGDALHQWPVVYHYIKQTNDQDIELWLDETTCKPLVPLFEAQPGVKAVKLVSGVENYSCGGQPFHMNLPTEAFSGNRIYHLGLRQFPVRQLSLQCLQDSKVPIEVSPEVFAEEPSLRVDGKLDAVDLEVSPHFVSGPIETAGLYSRPGRVISVNGPPKANRLVVHGQSICPHNRATPTMWRFLSSIAQDIHELFEEVVFVGSAKDREVGLTTYPNWTAFDDDGDFLKLARFIAGSRCMIGVGSSPIVLAGLLKVPSVRVHDRIGNDAPRVIWDNLGSNQLNRTYIELRTEWPKFRDRWLKQVVAPVEQ